MAYELLATVSAFVVENISGFGYYSIFVLMALESACFPIPSEIIMPYAGFLVQEGKFVFWEVVFFGALGNLIGSTVAYFFGFYFGRPLIEKYGKYILITSHDLDLAERWFKKYGSLSIFFSRIIPVVRTFISLPAGIARTPFWKFAFYTFTGSLIWSFFLTYIGVLTGENWSKIEVYFKKLDWLVIIMIVGTAALWIYKKIKLNKKYANNA